jgi:hypothetical protein
MRKFEVGNAWYTGPPSQPRYQANLGKPPCGEAQNGNRRWRMKSATTCPATSDFE